MASVKKIVKSSKTKQAKQPGTRNPKAKASKQAAELKAKKAAAARALAARKTVGKTRTKPATAAKSRAKPSIVATTAAKKAAAKKKVTTLKKEATQKRAPARGNSEARRATTAGRGKAVLTRASASKRAAPARSAAKSVKPARQATSSVSKSPTKTRAVALNKASAVKVQRRDAAKPAAVVVHKVAESAARATEASASIKTAAAAVSSAAFKENVARLTEARKRAAAARPPVISSNLSPELNDRTAVTKKPEKKISAESSSETAKAIVAKHAASRAALQAAGKVGAKPVAGKLPAAAPSIEVRPAVAEPATPMIVPTNQMEIKPIIAPAKPAKAATPAKQLFKPNEFVVYPTHGVGQIIAIEEQEVAGFKLELFVISFIKDKMILKVPLPKVASVGMRKLADAGVVKAALDTLTGRARVKRTMWSRRAQEYEAKINSGDLNAIAEVVRDLYRSDAQPEQSYSERQLYEAALDRMAREIIVVQKLTETESLKIIEAQLQKGPRRGKSEELEAEEADIEEAA
jgi:CarD family transcriptional regulator